MVLVYPLLFLDTKLAFMVLLRGSVECVKLKLDSAILVGGLRWTVQTSSCQGGHRV